MRLFKSQRRKVQLGLLVGLTGTVFGQGSIGCAELALDANLAGTDFCFLFNCQEGFFSGVIQPCDPEAGFTLFIDCPELSPPFGSGLGTEVDGDNPSASDAAGGTGGFRPPFEPTGDGAAAAPAPFGLGT
jgi:hypothetical protein